MAERSIGNIASLLGAAAARFGAAMTFAGRRSIFERRGWCAIAIGAALMQPSGLAVAGDTAAGATTVSLASLGPLGTEAKRHFAIPRQPLDTALVAFTAATGIQVFYSSELAAGRFSPGVTGTLSPDSALRALLAGTSLAPAATTPDAVTLVLAVQDAALPVSLAPPPRAPVLTLDRLHVEAPAVRGYQLYAATVQNTIRFALRQNAVLRQRRYDTSLNVWVSPDGAVRRVEIFGSTGDPGLDFTINKTVLSVVALGTPPDNLPQPMHVRILAGGADREASIR